MYKSIPEVKAIVRNWANNSVPIKLVLIDPVSAFTLNLRAEAWPLPDSESLAIRLGVEGISELILSLDGARFDLEDSTEAPSDLRAEAMGRTVRCLTCVLGTGMTAYFYELWAAPKSSDVPQ